MKYAFIGLGNMASAIIRGMSAGGFAGDELYGHNRSREKGEVLARDCGLRLCESNLEAAEAGDVIILAVKPQVVAGVLDEIRPAVGGKLIISIIAGKPTSCFEAALGEVAVVRAMPNMCASIGAAITGVCAGRYATEAQLALATRLMASAGAVLPVSENLFAVFTAIGSCSIAYTALYIDALAGAGVAAGLTKAEALKVAENAALGAARLLLETGKSPAELIDAVCSPGGTTIAGLNALKDAGFEAAVHKAVAAAVRRDGELGR